MSKFYTKISLLGIFLLFHITSCNPYCGEIVGYSVSESDIETIINKHNELRLSVAQGELPDQPRATNLGPLEWDYALAAKAQEIADTCIYQHVDVEDPRFSVGQNCGNSAFTVEQLECQWPQVIQKWFDEHKNFIYPNRTKDEEDICGHYTQIVWADTYYVGCGFIGFYKNFQYNYLYFCNYGPGGNLLGEAPYDV